MVPIMFMAKTLHKLLKYKVVASKQIVEPVGIYQNAFYSNYAKDKSQPEKAANHSENIQKQIKYRKKNSWRILNNAFPLLGIITSTCIGVYAILLLGAPEIDTDGNAVKDDVTAEPVLKQYIIRAYREMKYYLKLIENPQAEKLLPDPLDAPYKQPKYTLVVELTDVLVHAEWTYASGWKFKKRPLLHHFLEVLKGSYEIVLYTAEQGRTVFSLMDAIDPNNIIAYKIVQGTTRFLELNHVKELNKLNRDLKKVICIDWNAGSVRQNPENLLKVKRWQGKDDDTALLDLAIFLKTIADNNIEDVREVLMYYKKYKDPIEAFRKKQEMLIEELDKAANKKNDAPKPHSSFKLFG